MCISWWYTVTKWYMRFFKLSLDFIPGRQNSNSYCNSWLFPFANIGCYAWIIFNYLEIHQFIRTAPETVHSTYDILCFIICFCLDGSHLKRFTRPPSGPIFPISNSTRTVVVSITFMLSWLQPQQPKHQATTRPRTLMQLPATMINERVQSTKTKSPL